MLPARCNTANIKSLLAMHHQKLHSLALAQPAHPPAALRQVAKGHVFAERHCGAGVEALLDVHAGGVDLIAEGRVKMQVRCR